MTGKVDRVKVTLITQWFPPEPAELWKELAKGLIDRGYDVTVITAFPNYPYGKIYDGYRQELFYKENIEGINVIRIPVFPDHSASIFRRGLSYISFAASLMSVGFFRMPKTDLILCYSPPLTVALVTSVIAQLKRTKFIVNIQDMWPDTLVASGYVQQGSFLVRIIDFFAKLIYKKSESIVVLSQGFKKHIERKYALPENATVYIPNLTHVLNSTLCPVEVDIVKRSLGLSSNDFIIVYAGNMGEAQALDIVIDAVTHTPRDLNIKLLLVGDGVLFQSLKDKVKKAKIKNVIFTGRVSSSDVGIYYSLASALLIHLKKDDLFKITIPHKIMSYLEAGKPVLSAATGEVNLIVEEANAGLTSESGVVEELAENIIEMASLPQKDREKMGENAKFFYDRNFSRESVVDSWDQLIKRILL